MKKLILYLKSENEQLKEMKVSQQFEAPRQDVKLDNDNIINNLMDKINVLTDEKEKLQNAVRHLKEMSTLADKSPMDKQLWILKRSNAQLIEEKKALEERINSLQREILEKNLKLEEFSKRLGVTYNFKPEPSPQPNMQRGQTWTDKLKQVFT